MINSDSKREVLVPALEWSKVYVCQDLAGLELLHARFVRHQYSRHAHESAVIGLVESGVQSYFYRGARYRTGPGGIFVVNPQESHTGESAHPRGYVYRAMYPAQDFLNAGMGNERAPQINFREAVIYDAALSHQLRCAHLAVQKGSYALTCEMLSIKAITAILRRNGINYPPSPTISPARRAVRRVCDFIDSDPGCKSSLVSLARIACLSPFHLAHVFSEEKGIPLHVYADMARMRAAKTLLKEGSTLVDVATRLGYVDQSHFSRRFKQIHGLTPGQYQKSIKRKISLVR